VSTLRIGAGRYVIYAWPALLLFAAIALVALGSFLADLVFAVHPRVRTALRAAPAVLAVGYTAFALMRVEPYPLDYFDELVGGPAGVAASKLFEVPWWGEGNLAAVRALDTNAPQGARVHLNLWPKHVLEHLRDDLVLVEDPALADYDLVSHLQYFATPAPGCTLESSVQVAGAPLVDTYRCPRANPTQLGFASMHDPSKVDEAILHFQDALKLDPHDPGAVFGLGWAAQTKGDVGRAESLYQQAAAGAARANDADTEYFARFNLGTLYLQRGSSDKAADALRGALVAADRAPERFADAIWQVWANLGAALAASGHASEARAAFEHALALKPGEPSVTAALARLTAAAAPSDAGADATSSAPRGAPPRR
jgi:predicted negative regulator of RcsB-dependent stress response